MNGLCLYVAQKGKFIVFIDFAAVTKQLSDQGKFSNIQEMHMNVNFMLDDIIHHLEKEVVLLG